MSIDLERNAWAVVAAVRNDDREALRFLLSQCDHAELVEELAQCLMSFMAVAKINALHAQLGWPIQPDTFTRAKDVDSFIDLLVLSFAGQGEAGPSSG